MTAVVFWKRSYATKTCNYFSNCTSSVRVTYWFPKLIPQISTITVSFASIKFKKKNSESSSFQKIGFSEFLFEIPVEYVVRNSKLVNDSVYRV